MAFHWRYQYDVLTTKEMNKGVLLPNLYIRSISNLYPCKKVHILINEISYSDIDQIAPEAHSWLLFQGNLKNIALEKHLRIEGEKLSRSFFFDLSSFVFELRDSSSSFATFSNLVNGTNIKSFAN